MASTTPFLTTVANRHSRYSLLKNSPIPNSRILEIVHHALAHGPSPFNVRSTRCLVFFGDHHTKLWQHAYDITERETPAALGVLGPKIKGYQAGCGTVCQLRLRIWTCPIFAQTLTETFTGPLLRRRRCLLSSLPSFPGSLQAISRMGRACLRHAPVHCLDGARGWGIGV
jgi:hypothetical protein